MEVTKLLQSINESKGSGPGYIPSKLLKVLSIEIVPLLYTIYVHSMV